MTVPTSPRSSITIGDRTVPLARLTLRALRPVLSDLELLRHVPPGVMPNQTELDAMLRIVHASAQIIVPALTLEELSGYFLDADLPAQDALVLLAEAFTLTQTLSLPPAEGTATGEAPSL